MKWANGMAQGIELASVQMRCASVSNPTRPQRVAVGAWASEDPRTATSFLANGLSGATMQTAAVQPFAADPVTI